MRRLAAVLAASFAVLVTGTGTAAAHAELISMTPADGSAPATAPAAVVLRYNEPVGRAGLDITVTAPSGTAVSDGPAGVLDTTVTQPLRPLTEPGRYQVTARVVSADGHPVAAAGTFVLRTAATAPAGTAPDAGSGARTSAGSSGAGSDGPGSTASTVTLVAIPAVVVAGLAVMVLRRRRGNAGTR